MMQGWGKEAVDLRFGLAGALCAALALATVEGPAEAKGHGQAGSSGQGKLQCWGVRAGMNSAVIVYAEPSFNSAMLGVTHAMVAATGQPLAGFVPVVTSSGVRGFVDQRAVSLGRWTGMNCTVSRDPSGHLHFQYGIAGRP